MQAPLRVTTPFGTPRLVADPAPIIRGASRSSVTETRLATRQPRILVVTTGRLASTARLAMELRRAGAAVSLVAPAGHPARVLKIFETIITHSALAPWQLLEKYARRLQPDAIVPCDEKSVRDLHELYRRTTHRSVQVLVEASLGPAAAFDVVESRHSLLSIARKLGIRVPVSMPLPDVQALDKWMGSHAAPFVLKADGSWAGFGVRIITDAKVAHEAWQQMRRPTSFYLAARQLMLEGDTFPARSWMQQERPVLSVQSYIDGWPANIGVACWRGQVLATSCVESVSALSATGPSTAARIIESREMVNAASKIVEALGLSGLVGFDFMIEAATGHSYLIEMNPRVTPICTIPLGAGHDLPEALAAHLAGRTTQNRPSRTDREIIVYFPDTLQQDPSNQLLHTGYHDVPWDEPELVRRLLRPELRDRFWVLRMLSRLRQRVR
jgi:ATP-grasp domain